MKENWKDIPGYEGQYQASTLGRIRSLDREVVDKIGRVRKYPGKIRKPLLSKREFGTGYLYCFLYTNLLKSSPRGKCYAVHRLVASAFLLNQNDFKIVHHKNGIKSDNRVENLEWTTLSGNLIAYHLTDHSFTQKGSNHWQSKLTKEKVLEIKSKYVPRKYSYQKLAKEYGVCEGTIVSIFRGRTWKHS